MNICCKIVWSFLWCHKCKNINTYKEKITNLIDCSPLWNKKKLLILISPTNASPCGSMGWWTSKTNDNLLRNVVEENFLLPRICFMFSLLLLKNKGFPSALLSVVFVLLVYLHVKNEDNLRVKLKYRLD
jgi:hypothetical protein